MLIRHFTNAGLKGKETDIVASHRTEDIENKPTCTFATTHVVPVVDETPSHDKQSMWVRNGKGIRVKALVEAWERVTSRHIQGDRCHIYNRTQPYHHGN